MMEWNDLNLVFFQGTAFSMLAMLHDGNLILQFLASLVPNSIDFWYRCNRLSNSAG